MKLTKAQLDRLPLSDDAGKSDVIYFDEDVRGFGLRIRSGGSWTWIVQFRTTAGVEQRQKIGRYPLIEPDEDFTPAGSSVVRDQSKCE